MTEISDESVISIPLRNLIAMGAGLVMATTAYVTITTRLTQLEHAQQMQAVEVARNTDFTVTWPKEGLLQADVEQFARIDTIETDLEEIRLIRNELNEIKITLGIIENRSSVTEDKVQELFNLWNAKLAEKD